MKYFFRNVLYPTWHWAKKDGVNSAIEQLEHNQWSLPADLAHLQQEKLSALLEFAARHVPYYKSALRDLDTSLIRRGDMDQFLRLPLLTKDIIRHQQQALVSNDLADNGLVQNSTSGSTGEATRFFTDLRSKAFRRAAQLRSDAWTGWQLGDRVARLWGASIDAQLSMELRGRLHGWVTGNRLLSSFDLSASTMDRYAEIIRRFRPYLLVSYPGPMEQFALHCRQRNVHFPSLRAIVTSAETLWPHQRELAESTFGVRVFDRYGCREFGQIAAECDAHDGLHVSTDRLLLEVIDDEGQPCAPGQLGRILITDLDNTGMPLIRYEIGDRGAWAPKSSCRCGRSLPLLQRIEGRSLEVVRTPDGRQIGGTFWTLLLRSRPGLRQIQVIQDEIDGVTIHFIRDSDFNPAHLDYFTARIREYCGDNFGVEFVERESIDLTNSGKRRLIISRFAASDAHTGTDPAKEGN